MKPIAILFSLLPLLTYAQLPSTELWAINIQEINDTALIFDNVRYLSHDNISGYNNQPFPHADGYALTIAKAGHDQTDICFYNLNLQSYQYLTSTRSTSEYSPQIYPEDSIFIVVRVDTAKRQNLWALPLNLSHGGYNMLPGVNNIGYYHRLTRDTFAVFLTGEPHQLAIAQSGNEKLYTFTSNVGRCLQSSDGILYFIHKLTPTSWYLKSYNYKTKKSSIVCRMPHQVEDFVLIDQTAWLAHGGQLMSYNLEGGALWKTKADLSPIGMNNITRLAAHNNTLYIVNKK